ncbi:hypothetical protein ACSBR2_040102 [Camellia fascicularis]
MFSIFSKGNLLQRVGPIASFISRLRVLVYFNWCTVRILHKDDNLFNFFLQSSNQNRLQDFIKQTLMVETKSRGRQELPSDLFTTSHSSFPAPVPSWQVHPPYGMGYGMQYHPTAMSVPTFPNSAKSRNPFDLNDDNNQAQGPMVCIFRLFLL